VSGRKARWAGLGLVAATGAGFLGLAAMMNPTLAHADGEDIGLVIGGSGTPIPGPEYVYAADLLYLDNPFMTTGTTPDAPIYPGLTFYGATGDSGLAQYGSGLYTPEGWYPLGSAGVHQLLFNYPTDADGFPDQSSSIGQGLTILENTIAADTANGDSSTVFGYSQSAIIASYAMEQLDPSGTNDSQLPGAPQFLLIGDPSAPNGGLFERLAGFETTTGNVVSDPLSVPSMGYVFDIATPSDDYTTSIYSLEYDGFTDFPRYPLDFLSDLNAFLGIAEIHGTYLTDFTPQEIAQDAFLLPGSEALGYADSTTNYYMIDQTAPLVSLLPTQLQELLGPDLTYLINLGYGDGSEGYSATVDSPANMDTPMGLFPDVSASSVLSTLVTDTEQGFEDLISGTDPYSAAADPATSATTATSVPDLLSALEADAANPAASLTDLVNAISSATSTAYSTLLPLTDIANALLTSGPAWEFSIFADNLSNGDLVDAIGLPIAGDTALNTLAGGFAYEVIENAATQIAGDFSGLF
jgi:PE-PPE domain